MRNLVLQEWTNAVKKLTFRGVASSMLEGECRFEAHCHAVTCSVLYSIGTVNSTGPSWFASGGSTAPPVCRSRQCSGPSTP